MCRAFNRIICIIEETRGNHGQCTFPVTAAGLMHHTMLFIGQVYAVFWIISLLSYYGSAYELQDTIHTLKEENLHLQHRLENLTQALTDIKHLLSEYSKVSGGEHDPEYLYTWKEWSQHGISKETHQTLEQVLCLSGLHGAAQPVFITLGFYSHLFSPLILLLLS